MSVERMWQTTSMAFEMELNVTMYKSDSKTQFEKKKDLVVSWFYAARLVVSKQLHVQAYVEGRKRIFT